MAKDQQRNKISILPIWFGDELLTSFKAGITHTFLLHGNINDLVIDPAQNQNYITIPELLRKALGASPMLMFYDIASGLKFLRREMEAEFRRVTGFDKVDATGLDPRLAGAKESLAAKRPLPSQPEECLPLIEKALERIPKAALIIDSVHALVPASGGGLALSPLERTNIIRIKNWGQSTTLKNNSSIIIMLTEQAAEVASELRRTDNGITTIFIPKPDKNTRSIYLDFLLNDSDDDKINLKRASDLDIATLAQATQGMSLRQILDLFYKASQAGTTLDLKFVKDKKREILNQEYGEVMEIVEPLKGLEDIGGLEHIKDYFRLMLDAIGRGEERLVAMGILLMGPPGTGKTALVEALAKEAGFNFVKTRNIRRMWVGQSEAMSELMIQGLRTLAPVVVMNDEADLNNADRSSPKGDSGVSERLMKMWMEFLSDPKIRGQVVVISCTNRPDRMDAALKRSGRNDERILVPMPTVDELPAIFEVMCKRYRLSTNITDFEEFAKMTQGFSGADIEKIVLSAFRFAFQKGEVVIERESLIEAIEDFIPSASQKEIDWMTLMGIMECSSRRMLPPGISNLINTIKERNLIENLPEIINQIEARKII